MLNTKQSQTLIAIVDTRDVPYQSLPDDYKNCVDQLEERKLVQIIDGLVSATSTGVTLVKIFKSGLDFSVLYRRLDFRSVTKLLHEGFDKCFNDGIHLNVIFKNMPDEHINIIENEIKIAREAKKQTYA